MKTSRAFDLTDPITGTVKYCTHDSQEAQDDRNRFSHRGWCLRCGFTNVTKSKSHLVMYESDSGMSPLCNECWDITTPAERFLYCMALVRSWMVGNLSAAFSINVKSVASYHKFVKWQEAIAKGCGIKKG